jgi:hypothetical protein
MKLYLTSAVDTVPITYVINQPPQLRKVSDGRAYCNVSQPQWMFVWRITDHFISNLRPQNTFLVAAVDVACNLFIRTIFLDQSVITVGRSGRSLAGIASSNPQGCMDVCLLWVLCVLSGRDLCDELITRPEESYRLWCVVVCDLETSWMRGSWSTGGGAVATKGKRTW